MLSISTPMHGVGHADYYIKLALQDYYTEHGHEPGCWFGHGAERLGLSGMVESQAYAHLLWGRSPDGRRPLVQNASDLRRQTAWDLTFSAPKGMSVAWALGSEEIRPQIIAAHRKAVETALTFLEEKAGLTRRGKGGERLEAADLLFALFLHKTSRAHDPHIHTHCVLINLAVRADGTTGALWTKEIFRAKIIAGAVYQVELAAGLSHELGFQIRPDRIGFQVEGVPQDLCRAFSKRRQAVEAELEVLGAYDAVTAKQATLNTRPSKVAVTDQQLRATWDKTAQSYGWDRHRAMSALHRTQGQPCTQRQLEQHFRDEAARVPTEQQTPRRLLGLAVEVAVELGADARMFRPLLRYVFGDQQTKSQAQPMQKTAAEVQETETTALPVRAAPTAATHLTQTTPEKPPQEERAEQALSSPCPFRWDTAGRQSV